MKVISVFMERSLTSGGPCGEGNHLHTAPVLSNPPLF